MNRPFRTGLLVGRFQAPHIGHNLIIDKALELCDETVVLIGSAQEERTFKNPFSYAERKMFLQKMYGDALQIYPLDDIGAGNNCTWGSHVYEQAALLHGSYPDLFVSGEESRRNNWFADVEGCNMALLSLPKTIDISATSLRTWLLNDDQENRKSYTDQRLWDLFDFMAETVKQCKDKTDTASI